MIDIQEWLDAGNTITQLPEQPPQKFLTGSLKMHLIAQLQTGEKTQEQLQTYFGNSKELNRAYKSANANGTIIYKKQGVYSLEPITEKQVMVTPTQKINEKTITGILIKRFFRNNLVELNNYFWTEYECDILSITTSQRPIEIEIKTSRSDFYADAKKQKWKNPLKVWKHFYIMPDNIYDDSLIERLPNHNSGILTIIEDNGKFYINQKKPATVIADIKISPTKLVDMMRIINQRYWTKECA